MSQDLFAAFGSEESDACPSYSTESECSRLSSERVRIGTNVTTPSSTLATFCEDEDDFGDFEDASNTGPSEVLAAPSMLSSTNLQDVSHSRQTFSSPKPEPEAISTPSNRTPLTKPTYPPPKRSTPPPPTDARRKASTRPSKPAPEVGAHPFAGRMDFLFEADDDEYNAGTDEIADIASNPEAAMAYSKRVVLEQQAREEAKKQVERSQKQGAPKQAELVPVSDTVSKRSKDSRRTKEARVDVLLDAETDSGWGEPVDDYANVLTEPQYAKPDAYLPAVDLLALDGWRPGTTLESERTNTPIRPMTELARTLHHQSMVAKKPSPILAHETIADSDEWDDFEEAPASQSVAHCLDNTADDASRRNRLVIAQQTMPPAIQAQPPPPTNVPPPSVLMSMFPSLLEAGNDALFNTLSKLDTAQRQTLLSHPATHQFLRGYLALALVLAHVIVGRKLRWKRDSHLAQSMRIGPSVAGGGKGGMKLTGVDRGEVAKEDREVLDCIRLWKMQVGKLRSAVAGATASGLLAGEAGMPQVPELAEQMSVKTLKVDEGGFTAPAACALCGLKREERVTKVDVEVQDSFGEWWVDGANCHAVCLNFWVEHKEKLRSH
ncbi:hypothetical protein LTR78_005504 [Recurvomyces mirabilis]|uniref:Uncharacterized protein n=1 Tax=Recurvomyces mirabilis TaxID=574656 RepID=A0AAE0WN58_9PEZI|nr:hypothetical protein LTR78_005504 [Recurvomyces mirabilis]KAK5152587.1 hypothetical protein LTS14_008121 [Recurvomyces mirabilis]